MKKFRLYFEVECADQNEAGRLHERLYHVICKETMINMTKGSTQIMRKRGPNKKSRITVTNKINKPLPVSCVAADEG